VNVVEPLNLVNAAGLVGNMPYGRKTLIPLSMYPLAHVDVNLDGRVDLADLNTVTNAFGSRPTIPGTPGWNCEADLDADGVVNVYEQIALAEKLGQSAPVWPLQSDIADIAVTNFTTCKDGCVPMRAVSEGYTVDLNVTVANQGSFTQTFSVTAYANTTVIEQTVVGLTWGRQAVVSLLWNTAGFAYGNYTLEAVADTVPNETNTANNNFNAGLIKVTIPGDINGDFNVTLPDLVLLANAYGTTPASGGTPPARGTWNPNADINNDGKVSLQDLVIMANHYGQHYP
jgi:hypothetical protein